MRRVCIGACLLFLVATLAAGLEDARAQGSFEVIGGRPFRSAMPKDFYLEGNAIPTEERNAVLLKSSAAPRVLLALIDTAGYSSQIKQKYIGMLINEGHLSICGAAIEVGSYGFGLEKPPATSDVDGKFHLYNQAGAEVVSCAVPKDSTIKLPRPLQVTVTKEGPAWLYLGRYRLEIKP